MILERIQAMFRSCTTESPPFPPTLLYNEEWLLRLVVDWFSTHEAARHPLGFDEQSRWFSEALLPSAFLARHKGDPLAESWTHADGVIGHFSVGGKGKAALSLWPNATRLVVLEAKMSSPLSSGVRNAPYHDQAARTVACIAEIFQRTRRSPGAASCLGFYVLAPSSQIQDGVFAAALDRDSIEHKVEKRVAGYAGARDWWYEEWFRPTFQRTDVLAISWEELIERIRKDDTRSGETIMEFYARCIEFNQ